MRTIVLAATSLVLVLHGVFVPCQEYEPPTKEEEIASVKATLESKAADALQAASEEDRLKLYEEAAEAASRLVSLNDSYEHVVGAGEAWLTAKQPYRAGKYVEEASLRWPDDPLVMVVLARCYRGLFRDDMAAQKAQDALDAGASGGVAAEAEALIAAIDEEARAREKASKVAEQQMWEQMCQTSEQLVPHQRNILKVLQEARQIGLLKSIRNDREAWVDPRVWGGMSYDDKERFAHIIAMCRSGQGQPKNFQIRIHDNLTGKCIARWGSSSGLVID